MEKREKDGLRVFFASLIGFSIATSIERCLSKKEFKNDYLEKETACTAIIINDGVVKRVDNASKTGIIDNIYEVSFYDRKSLIIYVYNDLSNKNQKEIFADYIISNIAIGEDNMIYFDKNTITEEGFMEYKNNILNNNEESVKVRK